MNAWKFSVLVAVLAVHSSPTAQVRPGPRETVELIEQLADDSLEEQAMVELLELGSDPSAHLVDALEKRDTGLQREREIAWKSAVLETIILMGKDAESTFPHLGKAVGALPDELASKSLLAWGEVGFWNTVPRVLLWKDPRQGVVLDLGAAEFTVPGGPESTEELHRLHARIKAAPDSSRQVAIELLASPAPVDMEMGLDLVRAHGHGDEAALPSIQSVLRNESVSEVSFGDLIRLKAAKLIVAIAPSDPDSSAAYGCLTAYHHDPRVRSKAALQAANLANGSDACVPFLLHALGDDHLSVLEEVLTALGMIGPSAREAAARLEQLAEHDNSQIAARAKAALRQIRGN